MWVCKRQKTVECSTYGAELVAARIAIELIIELRYKLRMLGVKMEKETVLVGDNMSVVVSTTIPSSSIKKKHLSCAYHKVREAIAGSYVKFGHIESSQNLADVNTKPLGSQDYHMLLSPYLFRIPKDLMRSKEKNNYFPTETKEKVKENLKNPRKIEITAE